jgi:hypothetical protein
MIDYFALALGHGLLALALLRLALRGDVDSDPLMTSLAAQVAERRKAAQRGARGKAGANGDQSAAPAPDSGQG